jgi:hypothetical protein
VIVVGDGSAGWEAQTVGVLIENFVAELSNDVLIQLMRFDVEGNEQPSHVDESAAARSVRLRPRLSMRDVLATALSATAARPRNRQAIIVLASQEFYGSLLSKGQVISAARQREVPVYSIVIRRSAEESSFLKSVARTLSVVTIWLVESLIDNDEESSTIRETSTLLQEVANATGGRMYSATGCEDAQTYMRTIIQDIKTMIR